MRERRSFLWQLLPLLIVVLMPATAVAQTWYTLIDDEFIEPAGGNLANHVPETNLPGSTWSLGGSPTLIFENQAVRPSDTGAFDAYATVDARASDVEVGLYWYPNDYGTSPTIAGGVIFRYVSPDNYLLVHYSQQRLWLWKMTPSGFVHIAYADVA